MCVLRAHNVNYMIVAFCCESRSCASGDPFDLSNWDGLACRCTQGTTYYLIEVHLGVDRTGEIKARLDNGALELRGSATSARSRCYGADTRCSGLTYELSSLFVDTSTLGHEALGPVDADSWSGFRRSVGRIPCLDVCFIDLSESLFVETHRRSDFRYVCVERYQIVCPRNCQIVLCDNRLQGLLGYIVGSGMRRYRSSPDHS